MDVLLLRDKIAEAARYLRTLAKYRIPLHTKQSVAAAHGTDE